MRKDLFEKKNVKCEYLWLWHFFVVQKQVRVSCSSERSSVLCDTVFLWFSFSFFPSHQWGFLLFWSKVQWVDFLIYEVKGLIMGTKHFQIAFEWLSLFLLNVSQSLKTALLSCSSFRMSYISFLFLLLLIMLSHSFYFLSVSVSFPTFSLWFFFFLVVVVPIKKIALLLKEVLRSLRSRQA